MLVYLHLGAIFHTCLDFDTHVWEKAHMCEKSHTIICLKMFGFFHTCVGKATDMLNCLFPPELSVTVLIKILFGVGIST